MILKMSTKLRMGVTTEFTLGYKCTHFYARYVLPHRENASIRFLGSIKRKTNESS